MPPTTCPHCVPPRPPRVRAQWLSRRYRSRILAAILSAWHMATVDRRELAASLASSQASQAARGVLQAWHKATARRRSLRTLASSLVAKGFRHLSLSSLLHWRAWAGSKAARREAGRLCKRAAAARLMHLVVRAWRGYTATSRARRQAVLELTRARDGAQARAALRAWACLSRSSRVADAAAERRAVSLLRAALVAWEAWARPRAQLSASGRQLVRLRAYCRLAHSFGAWRQLSLRWVQAEAVARTSRLRRPLRCWHAWVAWREAAVSEALESRRMVLLRRCLSALVASVRTAVAADAGAVALYSLGQRHLQAQILRGWASVISLLEADAALMRGAIASRRAQAVLQGWRRWAGLARAAAALRNRHDGRLLSRMLQLWASSAAFSSARRSTWPVLCR